ncbi:MAG: hypothetical protein ACRDXB_10020 [Actinomycetes bacterium]
MASVAALAVATGGSTFALWGDWDTLSGSNAGADELSLILSEPNSQNFDDIHLAPGVGSDFEFVVASRQGETVPTADLRMFLDNLDGNEDGCTSTSSEIAVDGDCNDTATDGEFDDQARIIVNASQPTTDPNACDSSLHPRGSRQGPISLRSLYDNRGTPVNLLDPGVYLGPDQYLCVAMGINMPASANNASQGDSASFDLTFLLDQVIVP